MFKLDRRDEQYAAAYVWAVAYAAALGARASAKWGNDVSMTMQDIQPNLVADQAVKHFKQRVERPKRDDR